MKPYLNSKFHLEYIDPNGNEGKYFAKGYMYLQKYTKYTPEKL